MWFNDTNRWIGFVEPIERRPSTVFSAFAVLHISLWTLLPASIFFNPFMDVIEALAFGREWQLGYEKLPPLPWWTVEIVHQAFGSDVFYYAISQLVVIVAFMFVWATARPLVGATGALVAVLILDGVNYFHFTAVKFNHDVMQLPFWALAGYMYWSALRYGKTRHWILLGVAIGLALWVKYFVVVLVIPLGLFVLIDRDARRSLLTPGPYVAVATALLVVLPHLIWLVQNHFLPVEYGKVKWEPYQGPLGHIEYPAKFIAGQLWYLVPAFLIALPLVFPAGQKVDGPATNFDRRIIALLAFGPAATLIAMSLLSGYGPLGMWGYPFWLFLGLWCVLMPTSVLNRTRLMRVVTMWTAVFAAFAVAFVLNYRVIPAFKPQYQAKFQAFFPGEPLGREISKRYRAITERPLVYVVGSIWIGGNVAHYAPERPQLVLNGDPRSAPGIDLSDLPSKGAVVVWTTDDQNDGLRGDPRTLPVLAREVAEAADVQEPFSLLYRRGPGVVTIGWAILWPRSARGLCKGCVRRPLLVSGALW